MDWRIPAAWLTLCIVWSSTWLAIKVGLRDLPPISYVAIRFLVAIIALVLVSVGRVRLLPKRRSDYVVLAFTGVLMFAINYALLFWGESTCLRGWRRFCRPRFRFSEWYSRTGSCRRNRCAGSVCSARSCQLAGSH